MTAAPRPRVLTVEHESRCPPEYVGAWLAEEGVDVVVHRPYTGDSVPPTPDGFDGVLVLGGQMGAYDDATYPWLTTTKELLRAAVARDVPTWGICLGHQLMTMALGGQVRPNPAGRAKGLTMIGWTTAAAGDPLCAVVRRDAVAVQWNNDVVTRLPDRAQLLAVAPDGTPQAVRFARRAWGVQFHPEVGGDVFAQWAATALGRDPANPVPARALDEIRAAESLLRQTWRPLAKAFAAQLG